MVCSYQIILIKINLNGLLIITTIKYTNNKITAGSIVLAFWASSVQSDFSVRMLKKLKKTKSGQRLDDKKI